MLVLLHARQDVLGQEDIQIENIRGFSIFHFRIFTLTLLDAGVWRTYLGRGGLQKPPHLSEVLLVPLTQKMVPNPKTRQDKDVTT